MNTASPQPERQKAGQFSLKNLLLFATLAAVLAACLAPFLRAASEPLRWNLLGLAATAFLTGLLAFYLTGFKRRRLERRAGPQLIDFRTEAARRFNRRRTWKYALAMLIAGAIPSVMLCRSLLSDALTLASGIPWVLLYFNTMNIVLWISIAWEYATTDALSATECELHELGVVSHHAVVHPWSAVKCYYFSELQENTLVVKVDGDTLVTTIDPTHREAIIAIMDRRQVRMSPP